MPTTTLVKTPRTLVAAGTSNAATAATRGALDMRTTQGGLLTVKMTPAGTLGAQCVAKVMIAHDSGTTPATGAAGAVWKTIATISGSGTASGVTTESSYAVEAGVMHVQVEFSGNTTAACTVEAFLSEITNATTA